MAVATIGREGMLGVSAVLNGDPSATSQTVYATSTVVAHTHAVRRALNHLLAMMIDAVTAQRRRVTTVRC